MSTLSLRCIVLALSLLGLVSAEILDKGWWKNTVFYQVYPRSFFDSNDDGIGDLAGITRKLEHFKESGIGAIWLSPIYASPMVDFGYDISDFREIDEAFGTMADFEYLTKKAKRLGIKVILDLVPNHTSDDHEWFIKSYNNETKYRDYYIWKDGRNETSPPNNWISVFSGPAWTYNKTREMYYFHQFDKRQPDLNYANPEVKKEMIEVIKFWLGKGVDGFRVDAVPHIFEDDQLRDEPRSNDPNATSWDYTYLDHIYTKDDPRTYELIQSWRTIIDQWADERNVSEKVMMIEAYANLPNTMKYYTYGAQVPFNFKFITDVDASSSASDFKKTIDSWMNAMKSLNGNYVANWVMGNHDRPRLATRYPGRGDQMTVLAMTLPGVAVTYNGEEIGMMDYRNISWEDTQDPQACNAGKDKYLERSRDPNRTPFQWDNSTNAGFNEGAKTWLPVHPNYLWLNLANEKKEPQSVYKMYTALTSLKNNSLALKEGNLQTAVFNNNMVLGIFREHANSNDSISVLINFSNDHEQTVNITDHVDSKYKSAVIYTTSTNLHNITWGSRVPLDKVKLPAKATYVLQSKMDTISGRENGAPSSAAWSGAFVMLALSLAAWLTLNSM